MATFTGGSWRPLTWSGGYYAENVFEGLAGAPGTWYLDRQQGLLYYHPLPGEDPATCEVIAPATEQLVRFAGDAAAGRLVRNITLRGLSFQHTDWPLAAAGFAVPQADLPAPAAVTAEGAVGCRWEGCRFQHLGAWGLELRRGCRENSIVRCTLSDLGAGGVKLGEPENAQADCDETCRTLIADNRISDTNRVYLGSPAVWVGQSSQNTISHNEISGPAMWAISLGWTWSYFPLQRARDNIVEFNHCHDLGMGPLGTHCAIYALGTSPGTIIRNNYVHHVAASSFWPGAGEGIILDNGCCGIRVEDNVVHDAVAGGFGTNFNCFGNVIVNNVFAYGKEYQLTVYGDAPTGKPQPKGEIFARNIVIWQDGPLIKEADWPSFGTLWDYNLYWQADGQPVKFMKYSWDEWHAKDLDTHSLVADPLFVDAKQRNFTLRPESPAFGLGFRSIDLSKVGPRP
ncbi:MAG: right-handed parallel beta-helix repeat-containing protein [Planctomycetota bacterium]|nr:right-handed parallel beta-helix repeat-containing protein [Planctomycetota bacterium]